MKSLQNLLILALLYVVIVGCDNSGNLTSSTSPDVMSVILDTDLGGSTDDLFAMQSVYYYANKGKVKLLGVIVDREGEVNAEVADIMNTSYGYPDVPIGLERSGLKDAPVFTDYCPLISSMKDEQGKPMFARTVKDISSCLDGYKLYRRLLADSDDKQVTIISIGFITSLSQLLTSKADEYSPLSGVDLVRRKVRGIYIMGGHFNGAPQPDYNLAQALVFSKTFFQLWPKDVDIVFSPDEVGGVIEYGKDAVVGDIPWTDRDVIKQVYMNCVVDKDQKMWDPLTVVNAVEGDGLFAMSSRGYVTFTDKGETIFTYDSNGCCRYQQVGTDYWNVQMLQKIANINKHTLRYR